MKYLISYLFHIKIFLKLSQNVVYYMEYDKIVCKHKAWKQKLILEKRV